MLPGNEIAAWCTLGLACLIIGESALESTAPFSFDKQMDTTLNHGDDRRLGSQTMFRNLFFALSPRFRAENDPWMLNNKEQEIYCEIIVLRRKYKTPRQKKHTTAGIRWWSPTHLLTSRSTGFSMPERNGIACSLESVVVCEWVCRAVVYHAYHIYLLGFVEMTGWVMRTDVELRCSGPCTRFKTGYVDFSGLQRISLL